MMVLYILIHCQPLVFSFLRGEYDRRNLFTFLFISLLEHMKCIDCIHFINIGVVVNSYYPPFIKKA